jgi:hypothetical protein
VSKKRVLLVVGILFHIGGRKIPGKPIASSGRDTGDTIGNPMLIQPKAEFVNLAAVCYRSQINRVQVSWSLRARPASTRWSNRSTN